jgi:hypothetical protein
VAEWSIAPVLKTGDPQGSVSSNLTASATLAGQCHMQRPSSFAQIAAFPSSLLLLYLAAHATEGWQLLVVAAFSACFVASWRRQSKAALAASYAVTCALAAWVAWANL